MDGIPNLPDSALDAHIQRLEDKLNRLNINLELAKAEKLRRSSKFAKGRLVDSNLNPTKPSISTKNITLGSKVRILNKYRGNKGKVGEVILISGKTATVHIPQEGHFVKYLSNLELLTDKHEE